MPYDYNTKLTSHSKKLRKNMTPEEKHLWYDFLKMLPVTVNRQKMIGNYIVDFYIHSAKIVIEIDGIQHGSRQNMMADASRDYELSLLGIKVLRYSNELVNNNFSFVCNDILNNLGLKFSDIIR